jgi:cytochrome c biogenesis protein CcmG/thiol:disulfide interchange protein DsbE
MALVPILLFLVVAAIFLKGLQNDDPSRLPSALVGKPAPVFDLPPLEGTGLPGLASGDLRGDRPVLVNVWASWCGPCRVEHPILMALKARPDLRLVGINYKDQPDNARRFLASLGQPFAAIGADDTGRAAIDWGVYGVPETFLVDRAGIVRFKWTGPLTAEAVTKALDPAIAAAARP